MLLLIRINSLDVVSAPDFNLSAVAAHIIRVLTVLAKGVSEGGSDTGLGKRTSILVLQDVLLFSELSEPRVLQGLTSCDSVIRVVNEQLCNQVLNFWAGMRDQLDDTSALDSWEVELHVGGVLLEVVKKRLLW